MDFVIEESMGYLTNITARLFTRALYTRIEPYGVGFGQWPFLVFLWQEDGLTQKELCQRIDIEDATAVRTLDRMEHNELVRRQRDSQDRRKIRICLTKKGKQLQEILIPLAVEINTLAIQGLTDVERQQLLQLVRRMKTNLEHDVLSPDTKTICVKKRRRLYA